jgi:hypothetical protein
LTREHIRPALTLLLNLIEAGIRIVQLHPVEVVYDEDVEPMTLMMALMELSRGNSESRMKAERLGKAWEAKRAHVRAVGKLLTRQLPAWVEYHNGKLRANPKKALALQRIFQLSAQGFGCSRIVRQLVAENVPPFVEVVNRKGQRPGRWLVSYVSHLLTDRRVLGEFQMRHLDGTPAGGPAMYYPQVISEELWQRARAGIQGRRVNGKKGMGSYEGKDGFINLFTGLLRDARNEGTAFNVTVNCPGKGRGTRHRILRNLSIDGHARSISFPYGSLEQAFLDLLAEIDPADISGSAEQPDERLAIAAELESVAAQIARIKDNLLTGGDVASLADVLRQLEAKQRDLAEQEKAARQREALPLAEAWRETKSLLEAMKSAEDQNDFRSRLRAVLRREIAEMWVLIVPRGCVRLCALQVWFTGGRAHRDYLLMHCPPKSNGKTRTEGGWACRSLADAAALGELDLRTREHAEQLERALSTIDLAGLVQRMQKL